MLVAESDINRAYLLEEWAVLAVGVRAFGRRARSFGSIASTGALLVTGLAAFRRSRSGAGGLKPFWLQTILKGASMASTLWLALRAKRRDQESQ
jgi:hypothetical protein